MQFAELSHAGQYTLQALGVCNFGYIKEWCGASGANANLLQKNSLAKWSYARENKIKSLSCAQQ
jgi:O-acetyl-ADP-ribose deacetylase (regulator of RNase III)